MPISRYAPVRQRGAALIIGLIMLLILTLLGVTAISNVTLQERMAGSLMDRNLAFQAAEIALRRAEEHVNNKNAARDDTATGTAIYDLNSGSAQPDPYDINAWDSGYLSAPEISGISDAKNVPRYRIERQNDSLPTMYRLSAIGYGNRPGTAVVLQVTFSTFTPLAH
ncbi:pilus assembly PilX family protein [Thauera sp. SDU_THAU2]|uniref:pilus assembly PilX family protein n=1 Tax=Thauera sp. SDU_THAU2 TaxID=3136633 RepID=UPI003120087F